MTEPRKPGRPRKEPETEPVEQPVAPGPNVLEVRVGPPGHGKIVFSQRVYAHTIDQHTDKAVITGALRPTEGEK